ncbi:ArsR family transcriptional regulator [Candidatus Woesearchaeota archaeon]|nr:ArsR family transcriptional regulator [Candidatus Woesearchaeota archaeon]
MFRRIIIIRKEKPTLDRDEELQWISDSLGLFNERDKERSCYRIFVELLKEKKPLRSDDIALNSRLSRGTVVFHLNKLMDSGLVINEENKYKLREKKVSYLIKKLRKDVLTTLKEIEEIAKDFETKL